MTKKDNVVRLKVGEVTPAEVLEEVTEISDIAEIYVVVKRMNGRLTTYGSGDMSGMSDAALQLTRQATSLLVQKQEELDAE